MDQFIITHSDVDGLIHTAGIVVLDATGGFSWIAPGSSFNGDMLDEMERRGIASSGFETRDAKAEERHSVTVFSQG